MYFSVTVITFKAYVTVVMNKLTCFVSQSRVITTPIRRGGQFCCSFVANLLQYLCAKKYQNQMPFDKVIAKIKGCNFFCIALYYIIFKLDKRWSKTSNFRYNITSFKNRKCKVKVTKFNDKCENVFLSSTMLLANKDLHN